MHLGKVVEMAVEDALKEDCCNKPSLECFDLEFASLTSEGGIALDLHKETYLEGSSYKHNLDLIVVEDVIVIVVVAFGFGLVCCHIVG